MATKAEREAAIAEASRIVRGWGFSGPRAPITVVTVAIWRNGRVLMGLRKGADAPDTWCFPGGKADRAGETLEQALEREVREETGLTMTFVRPTPHWREYTDCNGQIFTCVYYAAVLRGLQEARVMEPEKCERFEWIDPYDLPELMFEGERSYLEDVIARAA